MDTKRYIKTFETYINDSGKLVQGQIDDKGNLKLPTETNDEIEREYQIEDLNKHLKDYLNKEYTFHIATNTFTLISDSKNDKGKISYDTKTYRLKKIIPDSNLLKIGQRKPTIYFNLYFINGNFEKREKLKIQLDKDDPIEIMDLKDVNWTNWSQYSIHRNRGNDKKKTFPSTSWFSEYTISDYPTYEKLKELQTLIKEIEKSINEDETTD